MDSEGNEQDILDRQLNIYNHKQTQALGFMRAILAVVIVFAISLIVRFIQNASDFESIVQAIRTELGSDSFAPQVLVDASSALIAMEGLAAIGLAGIVFIEALYLLRQVLNHDPPVPFLGADSDLTFPHQVSGRDSITDWDSLIYMNARRLRRQQLLLEDAYDKVETATTLVLFGIMVVVLATTAVGNTPGYIIMVSSILLTILVFYLGTQLLVANFLRLVKWLAQDGWSPWPALDAVDSPKFSWVEPESKEPVLAILFTFLMFNTILSLIWWFVLLTSEQGFVATYGLDRFGLLLPLTIYVICMIIGAIIGTARYASTASLNPSF